jgi:hypothetical protein
MVPGLPLTFAIVWADFREVAHALFRAGRAFMCRREGGRIRRSAGIVGCPKGLGPRAEPPQPCFLDQAGLPSPGSDSPPDGGRSVGRGRIALGLPQRAVRGAWFGKPEQRDGDGHLNPKLLYEPPFPGDSLHVIGSGQVSFRGHPFSSTIFPASRSYPPSDILLQFHFGLGQLRSRRERPPAIHVFRRRTDRRTRRLLALDRAHRHSAGALKSIRTVEPPPHSVRPISFSWQLFPRPAPRRAARL